MGRTQETGYFVIHRKTMGRRMAAKLKEIKAMLRLRLHQSLADTIKWLQSLVRGYFQYHAIPGNEVRLRAFRHDVLRLWTWHKAAWGVVVAKKRHDGKMNHSRNQIFRGKITEPADDSRPVPIEGRAGTAIFMHGMTPHASTVNSSMHPWRTLILSYHAADAFLIYVGEMTVKNEMHARLVQGEQTSFPRFSTIAVPVPKYPGTIASLYELQELSLNDGPLKRTV